MTKRHLDWFKTNPQQPMVSHGSGPPQPRDDIELPVSSKAATTKPQPDPNAQVCGLTSPARQRMAERRTRGIDVGGVAFRRHA